MESMVLKERAFTLVLLVLNFLAIMINVLVQEVRGGEMRWGLRVLFKGVIETAGMVGIKGYIDISE